MGTYEHVKGYRQRQKQNIIYVMGGKCACCGYDRCNSALELHHLDPSQKDFTFSQNTNRAWSRIVAELPKTIMVCANCHREIHAGLIKTENLFSSFDEVKAEEITKAIEESKTAKINHCIDCGKPIDKRATRCIDCYKKSQRLAKSVDFTGGQVSTINRPNKEELVELLKQYNGNFTAVGRLFNLTSNAIVKWCKGYDLPYHSGDYKQQKQKQPYNPPKAVYMLNKDTEEILQEFENCTAAARFLGISSGGHIGDVCRGKRTTAYGYKWKYKEDL